VEGAETITPVPKEKTKLHSGCLATQRHHDATPNNNNIHQHRIIINMTMINELSFLNVSTKFKEIIGKGIINPGVEYSL
jgi:hypothetical protein